MTDRLQQIHQQLEPVGLEAHPDRLDGQVVLITGGAQGTFYILVGLLASQY